MFDISLVVSRRFALAGGGQDQKLSTLSTTQGILALLGAGSGQLKSRPALPGLFLLMRNLNYILLCHNEFALQRRGGKSKEIKDFYKKADASIQPCMCHVCTTVVRVEGRFLLEPPARG